MVRMDRAGRLSFPGLCRFAAFFVRESARGGLDVAKRVISRRLRVAPGLVHHRCRLPPETPARVIFLLCVGLLPGTLVAKVKGDELLVHTLDVHVPVRDGLCALEAAVAGAFHLELSPEGAGHE